MIPPSVKTSGLCSLEISENGIAIACASSSIAKCSIEFSHNQIQADCSPNPSLPEITTCDFFPSQQNDIQIRQCLTEFVLKNNLKKTKCCWMLHPNQYHLTLINTPNVPKAEYKSAVRWQIKDVINYPLEEAVVEIFYPEESEKHPKKIYVIIAQNSLLQNIANIIQNCYLQLVAIDIREFAIRNLITNLALNDEPVGFLDISDDRFMLVIAQFDRIKFVRHIKTNLKKSKTERLDELVIELQRSFDYCATSLGQKVPTKIFIPLSKNSDINTEQDLAKKLGKEISVWDLQKIVSFISPIDLETQALCWPVIGGALRKL